MFAALNLHAQVQIERQVISPWTAMGSGSFYLDQTAGQPADITLQSDNNYLTQGFHQPISETLEVTYEIISPVCDDGSGYTVDVLSVSGCSELVTMVLWDGEVQELPITGIISGEYELVIIGGLGCSFADNIIIPEINTGPCNLIFYTGISPDEDQINDYWHIENLEYSGLLTNQVTIFNRWGSQIWSGENYDNEIVKWTGLSEDGNELPAGTYFWTFEAESFTETGFVEILR
jgi:gliding motility-associated-like protein